MLIFILVHHLEADFTEALKHLLRRQCEVNNFANWPDDTLQRPDDFILLECIGAIKIEESEDKLAFSLIGLTTEYAETGQGLKSIDKEFFLRFSFLIVNGEFLR